MAEQAQAERLAEVIAGHAPTYALHELLLRR